MGSFSYTRANLYGIIIKISRLNKSLQRFDEKGGIIMHRGTTPTHVFNFALDRDDIARLQIVYT